MIPVTTQQKHTPKMRIPLTYALCALICSVCCSCRAQHKSDSNASNISVLHAKNVIAFVEAHTLGEDITAGDFGDVVLLDIDTKNKYYVTDDPFLDFNPAISPNRRFVAFASRRTGPRSLLKAMGLAGARAMYIFDVRDQALHRFAGDVLARQDLDLYMRFDGLIWSYSGKSLYFANWTNKIFELSARGDSMWVVATIPNIEGINHIFPSRDDSLIAYSYIRNNLSGGIGVVNIRTNKCKEIVGGNGQLQVGGWLPDGRQLLIQIGFDRDSTWFEYDYSSGHMKSLRIPGDGSDFLAHYARVTREGQLILLAECAPPSAREKETHVTYILRFDPTSGTVDTLDNSGFEKSQLSVRPW